MSDERLKECVDQVTTELLTTWYDLSLHRHPDDLAHLTGALPALACTAGRCQGSSAAEWLRGKMAANRPEEGRKLAVAGASHLAPALSDPAALFPMLTLGLRDPNRLIRAQAAGVLAQLGEAAGEDPAVVAALLRCVHDHPREPEYLPARLRSYPVHLGRLSVLLRDLRENAPSSFSQAAALAALHRCCPGTRADLQATFQAQMAHRCWLVGALCAQSLSQRAGLATYADPPLQALASARPAARMHAAQLLGRLGPTESAGAVLEPLHRALLQGDLLLRTASLEALGALGPAARGDLRALPTIKALAEEPGLLQAIAKRSLQFINSFSGEWPDLPGRVASLAASGGELPLERGTAGSREADDPGYHARTVQLLAVRLPLPERGELGSEHHASRLRELEERVRQVTARREHGSDLVVDPCGLILFLERPEEAVQMAVDLAIALKAAAHLGVRMAVHTGEVVLEKDQDGQWTIGGTGLHRVRVVVGLGDAGHILVTAQTVNGLSEEFEWYSLLQDLGERDHGHLYNFSEPFQLFGSSLVPSALLPKKTRRSLDWLRVWIGAGQAVLVLLLLTVIILSVLRIASPPLFEQIWRFLT